VKPDGHKEQQQRLAMPTVWRLEGRQKLKKYGEWVEHKHAIRHMVGSAS
jgi:hypothetical protein